MKERRIGLERALLVLFVASGFAGLIYQAIWSHYLGLSLGHAAYAQTLVLAIFMGGMALGAWWVSRRGVQWRRLIFAYAVVEVLIGLAGLAFHPVFEAYTGLSQDVVYPSLSQGWAIRAWQWGTAALLIAPQSVLLGMTFPLMSGGYLRVAPKADGEILGGLYFTNSLGAAFGALFATFVLLPWVGMPGAVAVAGLVNLAVGVLAWRVSERADSVPDPRHPEPVQAPETKSTGKPGYYRMMLFAAAITGGSSFVYEIGWVRMLNQALGTTVHSFELMLAAFILGLAFGGLWIRRRSRRIGDPVAYAGHAQVWMGVAALASLPVFAQSFRWVGWLMESLPRTDGGYVMFSAGSAVISLLVMFPAAFFAGMTLPLFTMSLLRRGFGEASIGRIYAANTLGAIVGVAAAVHVLIPVLGLHLAVTVAAMADIVLGIVLLRKFAQEVRVPSYLGALLASAAVLAFSLVLGRASPASLASGVFRTGQAELSADTRVHFLRDGKTATVAFYQQGSAGIISTNGKPDASVQMSGSLPPTDDEITMLMAGALPLAMHPRPKRIGIIGWGSGLSTHTVLGSELPEVVDSVEIERAMYDGARLFGSRVSRAYHDPRSQLHIDDARTYFSAGKKKYDVIVSEPSNPWVSGVASLFTRQFYRFLSGHLEDDGILVQWLQTYELNDRLLSTILAAIDDEFPHVDAYITNQGDVLLVASRSTLRAPSPGWPAASPLQRELTRVGLDHVGDYQVRRIGGRDLLETLVALNGAIAHDDFHPTVSLQAPRSRFKGEASWQFLTLAGSGLPVLEMTDGRLPPPASPAITEVQSSDLVDLHAAAVLVIDALRGSLSEEDRAEQPGLSAEVERLRVLSAGKLEGAERSEWLSLVTALAEASLSQLPPADLRGAWIEPSWIDVARLPPDLAEVMAAYAAAAERDAAGMRLAGLAALAHLGQDAPLQTQEHMLVTAMLGAIAGGDPEAALAMDREQGRLVQVGRSSSYGLQRAYLLAWIDRAISKSRDAGKAPTPSPAS